MEVLLEMGGVDGGTCPFCNFQGKDGAAVQLGCGGGHCASSASLCGSETNSEGEEGEIVILYDYYDSVPRIKRNTYVNLSLG